ncbi:hypothetical protein ACQFX9_20715 [Aliinostoc sp. HNIBRCY26]|uniref:hypothetical protein n=1 Tax=Aliinostoc sp. HNIBRCY26 TaxID=3418997 RepID=UPI003CFE22BB
MVNKNQLFVVNSSALLLAVAERLVCAINLTFYSAPAQHRAIANVTQHRLNAALTLTALF